ncbi:RING/U-box superfamily protein [Abeliophyllum distichum]|uniref:RING-type E3 ubiquitin transferase n=1 Tax=Abeliophyllum distichum TaxID=126358 RepID=A0ABD1VUB1_9LAMI
MDEAEASRYWCHMCSQMVNPIVKMETIECPICQSGFVEEMASATASENNQTLDFGPEGIDSERALSLWAPILLGMMTNPHRHHPRFRRVEFEDDDEDNENNNPHREAGMELDREMESIIRRRRTSATILQLLQGIRAGMISESRNSESDNRKSDRDNNRNRERMILINPFNQTITIQGSHGSHNNNQNRVPIGSLGDYFIGPGLDLLLQHLAESDPNRYGTLPAQKEAVEALPTVKIEETLQCSVCFDDFEVGAEAKEIPCKHKFHSGCILPWLELHSSCPVCRYQLPSEESKLNSDGSTNHSNNNNAEGDDRNGNERRFSVPLPWPFSSLFSSSSSQSSTGTSSSMSPSGSSTTARPSPSSTDEN